MAQAIRSLVKGSDGRYRVSIVDGATGLPVEDITSYGGNIVGGAAPLPSQTGSTMPSALSNDTRSITEQVANPLSEEVRRERIQMGGGEGLNRQPSTPVADNAYNADGTPNRFGAKIAGMATGMVGGTVGAMAGGLVGGPIGAAVGGLLGRQLAGNSRLGDRLSPNGQLYGLGIGQPKAEAVIAEIDKENAQKAPATSAVRTDRATRLNEAPVGAVERTSLNPVGAGSPRSSVPSFDELSAQVGTTQDGPVSVSGRPTVSVPNTDARPTIDGQPVTVGSYNPTFTREETRGVQQGMRGLVSTADRTGMNAGIRGVLDAVESAVPGAGINSGYRSPEHNAKVGGARDSQHIHGNAADISLRGMTEAQKVATLEASIQAGARGLGIYNGGTTLHADTRQSFQTWGPDVRSVPRDADGAARKTSFSPVSINDQPSWAQPSLRAALGAGQSQVHSLYGPMPTDRSTALAANEKEATGKVGAFSDQISGYMSHARQAESAGDDNAVNNMPGASAAGRYGFTSGTWADVGRRHPELGLTEANRMSGAMQDKAMRAFTEDNAASLRSFGMPTTNANLYTAHHLGIGGARSVLTAPDDTKLSSVLSGLAMKQNPHLRDMTVADFKTFAEKKAPETTVADETKKALEEGSVRPASQPAKTTAERAAEPEDRRQHDPDKSATEMARSINADQKAQAAQQTQAQTQGPKASTAGLGMSAFNSLSFSGGMIGATADKRSAEQKSEQRDAESKKDNDTSKASDSKGSTGSKSSGGGGNSSDKGNQNTSKDTGKGLGSSSKSRDDDSKGSSSKSNDSKSSGSSKGGNKK